MQRNGASGFSAATWSGDFMVVLRMGGMHATEKRHAHGTKLWNIIRLHFDFDFTAIVGFREARGLG